MSKLWLHFKSLLVYGEGTQEAEHFVNSALIQSINRYPKENDPKVERFSLTLENGCYFDITEETYEYIKKQIKDHDIVIGLLEESHE